MTDKGKILAVDDTPASLRLLTDILKTEGYEVRSAISGELALRSAISNPPELVLLDINMPEMNGFEVCRRLKAQPETRDVPVIFVSALSETVEKVQGFELGAVDFVTKPFQRDEMLARVRTHLELTRLRDHLEELVAERTSELERAKQRFQIVADNAVEWSFWRNPDDSFNYVSPASKAISGYSPEELYDNPRLCIEMVHPDDREKWLSHVHQADQNGQPSPFEYRIITKSGQTRWIAHTCRPIHDDSGVFIGVRGSNADVTERKRAEALLREKDLQYQVAVETSADGFWVVDMQGRLLEANHAYQRDSGYSREELIKMAIPNIDLDSTFEAMAKRMAEIVSEGGFKRFESVHKRKDGSVWPVEIVTTYSPLFGGRFFAFIVDLTERKRAREELQHLNETLAQRVKEELAKNREKDLMLIQQSRLATMGEMMHNVAHQWRQPLNTVGLVLQNIKMDFDDGLLNKESLKDYVSDGVRVVERMSTTIDDFRNFFRPDREKARFGLNVVVNDSLSLVKASFENHQIAVIVEASEEICVEGFPNEYAQVLLNILTNAKEAIKAKSCDGLVVIRINKDNDMGVVRIGNNGGPIPEDVLPKIFDPYFTTKQSGSGIGLYMSRMIMSHLHGHIDAHNVDGGTEFVISMPAII